MPQANQVPAPPMFHWETDEVIVDPKSLNYRTVAKCDGWECGERKEGIMFHAAGATGRVCPVLFLCDECNNIYSDG